MFFSNQVGVGMVGPGEIAQQLRMPFAENLNFGSQHPQWTAHNWVTPELGHVTHSLSLRVPARDVLTHRQTHSHIYFKIEINLKNNNKTWKSGMEVHTCYPSGQ